MKKEISDNRRIYWVDIAKFLAILAVMTDHTNGVLYSSHYIAYMSYFSVSLFILMMGVTSVCSLTINI